MQTETKHVETYVVHGRWLWIESIFVCFLSIARLHSGDSLVANAKERSFTLNKLVHISYALNLSHFFGFVSYALGIFHCFVVVPFVSYFVSLNFDLCMISKWLAPEKSCKISRCHFQWLEFYQFPCIICTNINQTTNYTKTNWHTLVDESERDKIK